MLIPSIDLRNGKVVQLVQGERLALEDDDVFKWVERFARFPALQLIDLDAAIGTGRNDTLVAQVCAARSSERVAPTSTSPGACATRSGGSA